MTLLFRILVKALRRQISPSHSYQTIGLDLSVRSLIGSRSRLQDVPKIAQLVEARVQAWFEERVVEPRVQVVGLPGL